MSSLLKSPIVEGGDALTTGSSGFHVSRPARAAAPPPGVDLDLRDTLRRRWPLACAIFLAVAGAGAWLGLATTKPVYEAETTIYVAPAIGGEDSGAPESPYPMLVNQQVMTILHYDTLSEAVRRLGEEDIHWKTPGETERHAVDRLRDSLQVQRVPNSYEIAIGMTGNGAPNTAGDPRSMAAIVNIVAESFLDGGARRTASGRAERIGTLTRQKSGLEQDLRDKLAVRAKLSESLQVVNLDKTVELPDDAALTQMRQAMTEAFRKRIEAEEQLFAGQRTVPAEAERIVMADPANRAVAGNLLQRQFELKEHIEGMLPSHPLRKDAETELNAIDAELQKAPNELIPKLTAQLLEKLRADVDESHRVESDLHGEMEREAANIGSMSRQFAEAEGVNADIARLRDRVGRIQGQIEEIDLQGDAPGTMRVFSVAQVPPVTPRSAPKKALGIALLALFLGIGVPVALDLTDSRIYGPAAIERTLGFPAVGMTIERDSQTEQFADEHLRRLVAGIERGIANGAKTIVLTGLKQSVPLALMGNISRLLGERGINAAVHTVRWKADSQATPPQIGLISSVISPGVDRNGSDVVLIDAPALLLSADAERVAAEADITLMIVQAGKNTRPDLVRGARLLERLDAPAVGVILQGVRVDRAGSSLIRELNEYRAYRSQIAGDGAFGGTDEKIRA